MKRALSELSNNDDIRPSKKRKLTDNPSTNISSNLFPDSCDHKQFEEIFKMIDNSELIKSLQIAPCINKEIAEYAVGRFEDCANNKCINDISILHQDQKIYEYNHNNANKIGYKWCFKSNKYYCSQCDAEPCNGCHCDDCMTLKCYKCDICKSAIIGCQCERDDCWYWPCDDCGNFKCCKDCNYGVNEVTDCAGCGGLFCKQCRIDPIKWEDGTCVCYGCYDDAIIECNQCNAKCQLLYKSNDSLFMEDVGFLMIKCDYKNCDVYVCFNCDAKVRNGKDWICSERNCSIAWKTRCNKHIFNNNEISHTYDVNKCWMHYCLPTP